MLVNEIIDRISLFKIFFDSLYDNRPDTGYFAQHLELFNIVAIDHMNMIAS